MSTFSANEESPAQPLVDVNLITYNHEAFVAQAIESVLAQQTNFPYRLIIGDDCSTDNTPAIVRRYAAANPDRISLFLDPVHRGLRSRDRAGLKVLELSTAKYIAWLDGDDFWTDPHKLQKQVAVLERNPDDVICFHNVRTFPQEGTMESENLCPPDQKEVSTLEDLLRGNFIPSCSTMFRRAAVGPLPEWYFKLKMGDWPLYILIAQHGRIRYINEVMAAYRVHGSGSWSPRPRSHHDVNFLQLLDYANRHFDFRHRKAIDATRSRYYFELAETYYQRGHPGHALIPIKRGLRSSRFRHRGLISFYLQVKLPNLYNSLRSFRNFVRPPGSNSPGVAR
ncbi:MAG: glycosyl transferase, family 2 [Acidobacteria bacterium]|nr:glycosyl transferase, family 2 [Acidobacteriota bacterium]